MLYAKASNMTQMTTISNAGSNAAEADDLPPVPKFDIFIMSMILLNTVTMAVEHDGQSETVTDTLEGVRVLRNFTHR